MHRSGTSMVAGALAGQGFAVGHDSELMPGQADNPRGFFERRDVVALNDRILADAGMSWSAPGAQPFEPSVGYREEMDAILAGLGPGPLLLKDPRFALTWPCWREALENSLLVFVYRSPLPVASSLQRRNQFPVDYGLALWECYNRRILALLADAEWVAVGYDAFATDEQAAWNGLLTALRDRGCELPGGELPALFDAQLDHSAVASDPALSNMLSPQQRELAAYCEALVAEQRLPAGSPPATPSLGRRLADNAMAFSNAAQASLLSGEVEQLTADRATLQATYDSLEADHRALAEAHGRDEAELAGLREEREKLQGESAVVQAALLDLQEEHEALAKAYRVDRDELDRLRPLLESERKAAADDRERLLGQLQSEREERQALADAHRASVDELDELRDRVGQLGEQVEEREALVKAQAAEADDLRATLSAAEAKADYLFQRLEAVYGKLLRFNASFAGRVSRGATGAYKWLSLRPRQRTGYDAALALASRHFHEYDRDPGRGKRSRLGLLAEVFAYVARNPRSSMRSVSGPRLQRALRVFTGADHDDLSVWVRARFPDQRPAAFEAVPGADPSLDTLELAFPACEAPRVSIIVPAFNEYRVTMVCLRSLLEHGAAFDYEVIVADDVSSDLTASIEERVSGITVSRPDANLGFLRNCNTAAALARGELLVFLNNDTAVTQGWLDTLVATLDAHPDAGIVGPRLVYPDGSLQEAGGIVWDDASGWNYGREDAADKPAYNYLRDTDYVSGACLVIRTDLWRSLGGFDERFAPAYYEDTDLCFAARAAGYRVLYQPASTVVHFEGVSSGTDLDSGIKSYQVRNQATFRDKWQETLDREHFPNAVDVFHARDRSRGHRTVLVIDHYVPHYDKDAGSRSTWMYLELFLAMGYNVKFMGANFFAHAPYTEALQQLGVEVLVGEDMARHLERWLREHAGVIDAIYLHRPHIAEQFLDDLNRMQPRPPIIFFGHDLHYLRKQREFALSGDPAVAREAEEWKQREFAVFHAVDHVYYPSQVEVDEVLAHEPGLSVHAIPLYLLDDSTPPAYEHDGRSGMLFVGGFNHPPNADAVRWFVAEVLPLVRAECPDARLHLVGSNMPEEISAIGDEGVVVEGSVSDEALEALYARCRLAVVPLRFGAGVKGKVLEALQHGVPLVTTSVGAEGLPEAESVMHVADAAEAFAASIIAVERGEETALQPLQGYGDYLRKHFSRERASDILLRDFGDPVKAP
jgi:GT2 family glycosyltransferase/glycosyltransferase involved in cell wall biosynthesis